MIKAWRLAGFKSIGEPMEVKLAPLTVLTGPNSSGAELMTFSSLPWPKLIPIAHRYRKVVADGSTRDDATTR